MLSLQEIFPFNFTVQSAALIRKRKKKKKAAEAFHRKQDIAMRQMTELKVTKIKY